MENRSFYIQYQLYQSVKINTHIGAGRKIREYPLIDVADLIDAYKNAVAPRFDNTPGDEITLHQVVDGVESEAFRPGHPLAEIRGGQYDNDPLMVTTLTPMNEFVNYDWASLSTRFGPIEEFKESHEYYYSDRNIKVRTQVPLTHYEHSRVHLTKDRLPDLKYQTFTHIDSTPIQAEVDYFIGGDRFLGLLIGPTGCGKTHQMIHIANNHFTIFITAQYLRGAYEPLDMTLTRLKSIFESTVKPWTKKNEDLNELRRVAYAFLLSRFLFLKLLQEKHPQLTPTQFLIYQLTNQRAILTFFRAIVTLDYDTLTNICLDCIDFECIICVDEAHELVDHLGSMIISEMAGNHVQANGDVNLKSKRGTLSVLLWTIQEGQFSQKVIFAGTSSKLRNIDNFGTYESKPAHPICLSAFSAWSPQFACKYVSSLVKIEPPSILEDILVDNYRPRVLENFVYDLLRIATNDHDSPVRAKERRESRKKFETLEEIIIESYNAVIHRFTRTTIEPLSGLVRDSLHKEMLFKLLVTSMMSINGKHLNCQLSPDQRNYFEETIGAVYLTHDNGGYSFLEGYVIKSLLVLFEDDIKACNLTAALNLLQDVIAMEGGKSAAKGTPFEGVVLADLMKQNGALISDIVAPFIANLENLDFPLPTKTQCLNDEQIIDERPLNTFFRPSNQFGPDIIAFLAADTILSFGIKLYTSKIPASVHNANLKSTDPSAFFTNDGIKRRKWLTSLCDAPIRLAVRILIELPSPVSTIQFQHVDTETKDGVRNIIITISNTNMKYLLSPEVCALVDFITSDVSISGQKKRRSNSDKYGAPYCNYFE